MTTDITLNCILREASYELGFAVIDRKKCPTPNLQWWNTGRIRYAVRQLRTILKHHPGLGHIAARNIKMGMEGARG